MTSGHREEETEFSGPAAAKRKKIIHFSSGETMEEESEKEEDEEEEEESSSNTQPFREPTERTKISFRKLAFLVGRISLLTCDFLGERLAGVLGLNAAKYQYAIDQYHRDQRSRSSRASGGLTEPRGETIHLSPRGEGGRYGATGGAKGSAGPQEESYNETHEARKDGYYNRSYRADEDPGQRQSCPR